MGSRSPLHSHGCPLPTSARRSRHRDRPDVVDLGASPALATALAEARTLAEPRLSAPVRLENDGRLGVFAFAPVFAQDQPTRTPGERRDALRGVVVAALAPETLVHEATDRTDVAVTDGPAVLATGSGEATAAATARVGGRTWQLEVPRVSPSPLLPLF